MSIVYSERLIFSAEWFQSEANLSRQFYVYYFPADNTVEIFDHKTKKTFLKRCKVQGITESNFFVGAKLNIFGRQIDILDYADTATKTKLATQREQTCCLLKPSAIPVMDKIINRLSQERFSINQCVMFKLNADEANKFYADKQGDAIFPFLVEHITSGPIVAMEVISNNAVQKLLDITGPENPEDAREKAPNSLRAKFGEDTIKNYVYCSDSNSSATRDINYFFPGKSASFKTTAVLQNSTLGIIKPHAVADGKVGDIISTIYDNNFQISALKMVYLERPNCEEFYEVYKGVVPEYVQMVIELANGPCVAIEVINKDPSANTYSTFRKLCGPADPELAKQLRPKTVRAKFGHTKVKNAIHCTDLSEDTILEVEYFFKILP